jgi:hypothetical protein
MTTPGESFSATVAWVYLDRTTRIGTLRLRGSTVEVENVALSPRFRCPAA